MPSARPRPQTHDPQSAPTIEVPRKYYPSHKKTSVPHHPSCDLKSRPHWVLMGQHETVTNVTNYVFSSQPILISSGALQANEA